MTWFFLVLLRVAIGWHFFCEGWAKLESYWAPTPPTAPFWRWSSWAQTKPPDRPWSAEGYLWNASGPLAPYFRSLVPDPGGLEHLALRGSEEERQNPAPAIISALKAHWQDRLAQFADRYQLTEEQRQKALGQLDEAERKARQWLAENRQYVSNYLEALRQHRAQEERFYQLDPFEARLYAVKAQGLQRERRWLVDQFEQRTRELEEGLRNQVLTPEQRQQGEPKLTWWKPGDWASRLATWGPLDWINRLTMYGLVIMGVLLILGLFTRLAALAAAVFLASLYLAMPPWPGLPGTTALGGHSLFVNLHLIELLAVLAVAASGRWFGLDALLWRRAGTTRVASGGVQPPRS